MHPPKSQLTHTTIIRITKIQALETVSGLAKEINESIREYENEQRVISIGRRLLGKDVPAIAIPGRKYVAIHIWPSMYVIQSRKLGVKNIL